MDESLPNTAVVRRRVRAGWPPADWPMLVAAFGIAGALAVVAIALGWRGSDLPAQVFRTDLVRRHGFTIWDQHWFGGHATLSYSVLSPILGALIGPVALGAVSGVISAVLFERILQLAFGRIARAGALWFALATVTNLIVGRVTFALGVMFALGAVYMLQRGHGLLATASAAASSLSSPLAGCFLVIVATAWVCADRARRRIALATLSGAFLPLGLLALVFPTPGFQPFGPAALALDLGLCAIVALAASRFPALRWGAATYAVVVIAAFVIPTALGGNISRFAQYAAGPILAVLLLPHRRALLALLAVPLVAWQAFPAVDGVAYAGLDPSTRPEYYQPLLRYLATTSGPIGRVEIPPLSRHWEASYAGAEVLLARGWERQLDTAYNSIFYSGPLTAETYREWLAANGVAFVALADAPVDTASVAERTLLRRGLPYLHEVWHDDHWRVWRVDGFHGLVDGPASVISVEHDRLILSVRAYTDVVVRVRASGQWTLRGGGCAEATADDWTRLRSLSPGRLVVSQTMRGTPCRPER